MSDEYTVYDFLFERDYAPPPETITRHNIARDRSAMFSACETYRYALKYRFHSGGGTPVAFVMLNPSTANELVPDPTVRRCMGYAAAMHAPVLYVVNMFALRSTDPSALLRSTDPVGKLNDAAIMALPEESLVICAWGAPSNAKLKRLVRARAARVVELLAGRRLHALATTKCGAPRHPLYLRADLKPTIWRPQDVA